MAQSPISKSPRLPGMLQYLKAQLEDVLKTIEAADMLTPDGIGAMAACLSRLSMDTSDVLTAAFFEGNTSTAHPRIRKSAPGNRSVDDSPGRPVFSKTSAYFNNLRNTVDLLGMGEETEIVRNCMLLGYTFDIALEATNVEGDDTTLRFVVYFHSGFWDDVVSWPFKKRLALVLVHPKHQEADKVFLLEVDDDSVPVYFGKPQLEESNAGLVCAEVSWRQVKHDGFVATDAICVDMVFY